MTDHSKSPSGESVSGEERETSSKIRMIHKGGYNPETEMTEVQFKLMAKGKSVFVQESIQRQARDIAADSFPEEGKNTLWLVANALTEYAAKLPADLRVTVEGTVRVAHQV